MSLTAKQSEFTANISRFIAWCHDEGYPVILAEAFRPPEMAKLYEEQGKGISNSNHCNKLAVDLFRYKDGTVTWDPYEYEKIGLQWESTHPLARWGGRFNDYVHFSFEHNGVK